jgi:peroxiredoxin
MVEIGEMAPSFTLYDADRKFWDLSDHSGEKLVLAFFPGAFTSVCTKEMCAFRDSIARFNELKVQVVGISVNDPFTNKAFAEKNYLGFTLLSDYKRELIRLYDVEAEDFAGLDGYTVAKRSVFILDKKGIIRYKWISENPGKEPDYGEIESALNKLNR